MSDLNKNIIPDFNEPDFDKLVNPALLRCDLGWTQLEMQKHSGASRPMISKYETNVEQMGGPLKRIYWQLYHELKLGIRQSQNKNEATQ